MSNPCINCGVCCKSYRIAFHWSETTPTGVVPVELTQPFRKHEVIMIGTEGPDISCVALTSAGCRIHGRHPSVCRQVNVGDEQCQKARVRNGLSFLTVQEIKDAYINKNPPAVYN